MLCAAQESYALHRHHVIWPAHTPHLPCAQAILLRCFKCQGAKTYRWTAVVLGGLSARAARGGWL